MAAVLKTAMGRNAHRGFESHALRSHQYFTSLNSCYALFLRSGFVSRWLIEPRRRCAWRAATITDVAEVVTSSGIIEASDHQFLLQDAERYGHPVNGHNGLVELAPPGGAIIFTGVHSGPIAVSVEARRSAPDGVGVDGWDEVVEVSLSVPQGQLKPAAPMDDVADPFPILTLAGPGDYRIRIHARGRDTEIDGVVDEPVEQYRIVVWPAPPAPEAIHRQTDACGAAMREASAQVPPSLPPLPPDPVQEMIHAKLREITEKGRRILTEKDLLPPEDGPESRCAGGDDGKAEPGAARRLW